VSRVLVRGDPEWPARLDELSPHAPVERLYVNGRPLGDSPAIAVVGTRRPTGAGLEAARRFATGLGEAGITVVSGLAIGVDAAAHAAAMDAGGTTVAVLGCGLDVDYPRRNRALKQRIAGSGAVVTEHPDGTPPIRHHFPERNRIIAGLADGVVVIEGAITSGALVTARLALDCNRAIYALPGSVRNPMAEGPNELIRTGQAALVTDVSHIFQDLAPARAWAAPSSDRRNGPLVNSDVEAEILNLLDDSPVAPDALSGALNAKPGKIAAALSQLEVRGLVTSTRGGYALTTAGARARAPALSPGSVQATADAL